MQSKAATVEGYLQELSEKRCKIVTEVREVILQNLPEGYVETMNWGMISYEVPLETFADTYNKKPLSFVSLASQKNYCSLYMMAVYQSPEMMKRLMQAYEQIGKKPDMGKCCVRFKAVEDIPLQEIGKMISATPVEQYIEDYQSARESRGTCD